MHCDKRFYSCRYKGILVISVLALIVPVLLFFPKQSIWTDETTQLSGLTLGPFKVVQWLTGRINPFYVPQDRTPPFSYWLGMVWALIFGLNEVSMRLFALFLVSLAAIAIVKTSKRAFGLTAGLIAGLLFALSPNIIEQAVNIRPYPLFLMTSSCAFYCLIRILEQPRDYKLKWVVFLSVSLVAAIYTHFFGIVLAASFLLATIITLYSSGGRLKPIYIAILIVGLSAFGLTPFVQASLSIGSNKHSLVLNIQLVHSFAKLIYRFFAHPAMRVNITNVVLACFCFTVLSVFALLPKKEPQAYRLYTRGILYVLVFGLAMSIIGKFLFFKFDSTSPWYNIWMLPGIYILLSSASLIKCDKLHVITLILSALLIATNVYGDIQLAVNGLYFSHVRYREIESVIRELGSEDLTIVHDGGYWAMTYFPTIYTFNTKLTQYLYEEKKPTVLHVKKFPEMKEEIDLFAIKSRYILVIRSFMQDASDIAIQLDSGIKPLPDGDVGKAIKFSKQWKTVDSKLLLSFTKTKLELFERVDR